MVSKDFLTGKPRLIDLSVEKNLKLIKDYICEEDQTKNPPLFVVLFHEGGGKISELHSGYLVGYGASFLSKSPAFTFVKSTVMKPHGHVSIDLEKNPDEIFLEMFRKGLLGGQVNAEPRLIIDDFAGYKVLTARFRMEVFKGIENRKINLSLVDEPQTNSAKVLKIKDNGMQVRRKIYLTRRTEIEMYYKDIRSIGITRIVPQWKTRLAIPHDLVDKSLFDAGDMVNISGHTGAKEIFVEHRKVVEAFEKAVELNDGKRIMYRDITRVTVRKKAVAPRNLRPNEEVAIWPRGRGRKFEAVVMGCPKEGDKVLMLSKKGTVWRARKVPSAETIDYRRIIGASPST